MTHGAVLAAAVLIALANVFAPLHKGSAQACDSNWSL